MGALLYFLFWAGLILVMMRFGCDKTVATNKAKPSVHDGNVYGLRSRECREVFEAAPHLYVGGNTSRPKLEPSHV